MKITEKAQEFGLGINTIIFIILGLLVIIIALWLGGKTTFIGDVVSKSMT